MSLASDVDSLDPHRAASPPAWSFARAMHRGLYAFPAAPFPPGAEPATDIAASMPAVSRDRRTLTIRLRADARFGAPASRPVDAGDVRASIERLVRAGAGIAPFLSVIDGAPAVAAGRARRIAGITVRDARTVIVRLSRPANDLPWILAHPQAAILPASTPAAPVAPSRIAGAGPYRLASYRAERRIVLVRNPAWSRAADPVRGAWVDRIEATIGPAWSQANEAVLDGRVDLVVDPGPPDERVAVPERARPMLAEAVAGCVRYLFMNRSVAPFGDRGVRLAVAHAVRREAVAAAEGGAIAPRLLPPTVLGHATEPVLREDLARARALLRAAGRAGFTTTLIVGDAPRDRAGAGAVRAALARAGVRVAVRTVPPAALHPLYYEDPRARVPMGIATWCSDWPGLAGRSALAAIADPRRGPSQNLARLSSSAVVQALDGAAGAPVADAAPAWRRADQAVLATGSLVPLTWPVEQVLVPARVRGWTGSAMLPRGDLTAVWLTGAAGGG